MTRSAAAVPEVPATPTGRGYARLVAVLGGLIALGPLTTDMYLPAFPASATGSTPRTLPCS
jgi:DHA1 family bicyclomycin/chloramphenicol resistance-like MFS transporter